jgi:hypothetical protein
MFQVLEVFLNKPPSDLECHKTYPSAGRRSGIRISRHCIIGYLFYIILYCCIYFNLLYIFRLHPCVEPLFRGVHSLYKKQFIHYINKCVYNVLIFTYYEYVYIKRC